MTAILVIFTGGTIGSSLCNSEINTDASTHFLLLSQFQSRYPDVAIHFTTLKPYEILSENLMPIIWTTLIETIEKANPAHYDGIIVTHGTDTLAYTAAALNFYFYASKTPIFLVSSQYPLSNEEANGLDNFSYAVGCIVNQNLHGVFVPYKNPYTQNVTLHHGAHLTCSPQLSSDFFSITPRHEHFFLRELEREKPLIPHFSTRILLIKPFPGIDYTCFNLENVDVVLHDLYHSGTACTTMAHGLTHSLRCFITQCHARNIDVFLAPALKSSNNYQSTLELTRQGAKMIWNMTIEAAYVKLLLAYGNCGNADDILYFLNDNIAGEQI